MTNEIQLTISRKINASQKALFNAWIEPETLKQFMFPMPGTSITRAEVDARLGGKYHLVMSVGESDIPIHGEYKTFDKYQELSFTWLSPHVGKQSLVTLKFMPISENETELTLHHQGFDTEEEKKNHDGGWNEILSNLDNILQRRL